MAEDQPGEGRLPHDCFALPPGIDWTPVETALARLKEGLGPVTGEEQVALSGAAGRVLAQDVLAIRDNPQAANAAVDGYAIRFGDAAQQPLPLAPGRAAAGVPARDPLPPGHAMRILTGALIPQGADTVLLEEDCETGPEGLRFPVPKSAGANLRRAGEDCMAGEPILRAGRRLLPQDLARAAAAGHGALPVRRSLTVAVLSTGDEIVAPGQADAPEQIADANRPMLLALAQCWGHETLDLGIAPDAADAVRAALDHGAARADAILTSGGASAGDEDHLSRLLGAEGRRETWRIAMKPGRPLALGLWQGKPVFALPGNPVAAFTCALIFARPALARLAGSAWIEARAFTVPAAFTKRKKPGRREYLRARLNAEGRAEIFHSEGSGLVGGLTWAEGFRRTGRARGGSAPG